MGCMERKGKPVGYDPFRAWPLTFIPNFNVYSSGSVF